MRKKNASRPRPVSPLLAPSNKEFNWLEHHLQEFIVIWLRAMKAKRSLSFDIGFEGVYMTPKTRNLAKAQGMDKGVPDIKIKLPGGRLIHIELKRKGNYPTEEQLGEHELLRDLGFDVRVVTAQTPQEALDQVRSIVGEFIDVE